MRNLVGGSPVVVMGENMGLFSAWLLIGHAWGAPQGMARLTEDRFNVQEKVDLKLVYTVGEGGFLPGDELRSTIHIFMG